MREFTLIVGKSLPITSFVRFFGRVAFTKLLRKVTTTKGNGRVEGAIRRLKQHARVLMAATNLESKFWPFALQHAAARSRSMRLPTLGGVAPDVLPFGTTVYVRRRTWNQRGQRWAARGLTARVLSPSVEVTRAHVVVLSTGELMVTSRLVGATVDAPFKACAPCRHG